MRKLIFLILLFAITALMGVAQNQNTLPYWGGGNITVQPKQPRGVSSHGYWDIYVGRNGDFIVSIYTTLDQSSGADYIVIRKNGLLSYWGICERGYVLLNKTLWHTVDVLWSGDIADKLLNKKANEATRTRPLISGFGSQ